MKAPEVKRPMSIYGRADPMNTPYQKIRDASAITGLPQWYLRNGCKAGSIPHIKCGAVYYINIPALMKQLEEHTDETHT